MSFNIAIKRSTFAGNMLAIFLMIYVEIFPLPAFLNQYKRGFLSVLMAH